MNLFTQNSPYYHVLKYLLFLVKHSVCIYTYICTHTHTHTHIYIYIYKMLPGTIEYKTIKIMLQFSEILSNCLLFLKLIVCTVKYSCVWDIAVTGESSWFLFMGIRFKSQPHSQLVWLDFILLLSTSSRMMEYYHKVEHVICFYMFCK
jgi:hypothetical protein